MPKFRINVTIDEIDENTGEANVIDDNYLSTLFDTPAEAIIAVRGIIETYEEKQ